MASPGREKEGWVGGLRDLVGRKGGLWVELTGRWGVVVGGLPPAVVGVEVVRVPLVEVLWRAVVVAVEGVGLRAGLAASEARTLEMWEGRDAGFLAWGGAADGAVAEGRLASIFGGTGADLAVDGRPAGSFFDGVFADGVLFSFNVDLTDGRLFSFNADLTMATFFSFKADLGVVALVWPRTILLALSFVTGDGATTDGATDTAGRHSPISSMASSRASIASTESSIRVIDLAGDRATIFSTTESSLWLAVFSSFRSLSNVSVRVILTGVRVPMVPTKESS